jgi:hypothetical protein
MLMPALAPNDISRDFKSYASRGLNKRWAKPASDTWWTTGGSKRKLPDEQAVLAAIEYVKNQYNPLVVWVNPIFCCERPPFDLGEPGA